MTLTIARQMVAAEILKLRRNRALMALAFVLTSGIILLVFGFKALQHASDPVRYLPAGGEHNFTHVPAALGIYFGALSSILIGSEAGTADIANGVFRDLVATGRSRTSLFLVRAPAAIAISIAFSIGAFAIGTAASFLLAGPLPGPSSGLILRSLGWMVLANAILTLVAAGIGSMSGSRALTLTVLIGWQMVATNLLVNVSSLGSARDALLTPALDQLSPIPDAREPVSMAAGVAVAVLCAWVLVFTVLGAWRTVRRDA